MITRRKFLSTTAVVSSAALLPGTLSAQTAECSENLTFHLNDGRRLSYASYGDPNGWPVLYFHGIPTSRIEARFFAPAACRNGCRLIAIDRPGFGWSDFQCGRRVCDWLSDVNEFIDSPNLPADLDLSQFSIACFSSGSAYALQCASLMPPERLKSVGIVDGIAPLEKLSQCGGVSQVIFRLANQTPNAVKSALDMNTRQIRRRPNGVLRRISRFFSPCDRPIFIQPRNARILVDSYLQCVNCGPDGVTYDMSLLSQPWGVCLAEITQPVGLWYGECDITTPLNSMGQYLHRTLSNSQLSVAPNQGHLSMLNVAGDEMFQYLRSFID